MNYIQLAQALLSKRLENGINQLPLGNAPWAQNAIRAIQTGDAQLGEQLASNICNSYGLNRSTIEEQIRNTKI